MGSVEMCGVWTGTSQKKRLEYYNFQNLKKHQKLVKFYFSSV